MFKEILEIINLVNKLEIRLRLKLFLNFLLSFFVVIFEIYPLRLFLIYFENKERISRFNEFTNN